MFYRIVLCFFIMFSVQGAQAAQRTADQQTVENDPAKTVFDLERSVAILQVSSASVDDVQALQKQIDALKQQASADRVDFLCNLVFLLGVVVLLLIWHTRRLSLRLAAFSNVPERHNDDK